MVKNAHQFGLMIWPDKTEVNLKREPDLENTSIFYESLSNA